MTSRLILALAGFALCLMGRPAFAVPVIYADAPAIKMQIAAERGHFVLVNFWATWRPECVAEYPNLVKLDRRYRSRGLVVIAVSLDLRGDIDSKVKPFLRARHATFRQYVLQVSDPETAIDDFDTTWQGDLPRTFVYSRTGRLAKVLPGPQTLAQFTAAVKAGYSKS